MMQVWCTGMLSSPSGDESLDLALCRLAVTCPQNMPKITKELCDSLILHTERMIMSPLLTKEQVINSTAERKNFRRCALADPDPYYVMCVPLNVSSL